MLINDKNRRDWSPGDFLSGVLRLTALIQDEKIYVEGGNNMAVERIISGGQTGVDRAALDAALAAGIPAGGWCPAGRRAEDGTIPERYPMRELESPEYGTRTEMNVVDSDATLVLNIGELADGTAFTVELARKHCKPFLVVSLEEAPDPVAVASWLAAQEVRVLNVAGPRESKRPGVYGSAMRFLGRLFSGYVQSRP
jgi:hypothetical protein